MEENLEEPAPAGMAESAPEMDLGQESFSADSTPPEEVPGGGSLENALNNSEASRASEMPVSHAASERRGEGMMPQGSLLKIPVNVQVILGTTRMSLHKVMSLGPGSIVALDKELSEPVSLLVNGNEVARGLIVVVNEKTGQLGISLTEISSGGQGEKSSKPI